MKVWEKCNEVKGTNATIDEIARWAYDNRICPLDFDVALEIQKSDHLYLGKRERCKCEGGEFQV